MNNPIIQRGFRYPQRIKLLIMIGVFFVFGTLGLIHTANAAIVCWDGGGGGDTNWNTAANWEGDTQPGSGDVATFDSTDSACSGGSPNNNVTINVDPNVLGINITNYTGTITQSSGIAITLGSSGYAQSAAGSTFTGGNSAFDINDGSFALSNGAFTSTSNTLSVERNFTVTGGTFTHNSGTVTFDGTGGSDASVLACNSITFNSVTINKTYFSPGANVTVGSDCTLPLGNSPTSSVSTIINNGTITVGTGTWTLNGGYTSSASTSVLTMTGTVLDMNGIGGSFSSPGDLTLTDGTFPSGLDTLSLNGDLDNSGNKLPNGIDLTLDGSYNGSASILTCGTVTFNSVTINKTYFSPGANVTVGSDCTLPLGNSPTSSVSTIINNGTITVGTGTWTLNGGYTSSASTSVLTMTGTVLDMNGIGGLFSSSGDLTLTDGTFPAGLATLSLNGDLDNSGNKLPNGINLTLDGTYSGSDSTLTCGTVTFNSVTINKTYFSPGANVTVGSDCTLPLGNSPTSSVSTIINNGTITVGTGTWTLNGGYTSSASTSVLTMTGTVLDMNGIGGLFSSSGDLTLTDGTFPAGLATLSLNGDLDNSGNKLPNGINLTLDGTYSGSDSTLTCGTVTFNSVTIDKSSSSANTTLATNCTFGGNFIRTNGPMLNPASPFTLTVQGNFSMSTTDAFGGANLTLELSGTNAQNVTQNAGTIAGPLTINKTGSNAATLTTALVADSTCDIVEGIFDIAGNDFTCGSTHTVQDGGTLRLQGGETTVTSPTLASGSTVVYNGTAGPYGSLKLGNNYHHLTFDGADSWTMAATTDINGALTITTGTVVAPSTLTVAGNFTNSGTFTHSSGTLTLDGTDQTLTGATTFNNLTKTVTSAATLTLPASTTQTIDGTLTLKGILDNLLSLRSSAPGTQWSIDAPGIKNIEYLDIKDASSVNSAINCQTGCVNSGNNTSWIFATGNPGSPDTTSPEPIQDFIAIVQEDPSTPSGQAVLLTWTNSPDTDFKQVRIYRSTNTSFIPSIVTEIAQVQGSPSSPSSYIDTNVELNITYTYKILTEDILGNLQTGLFYPSVSITVTQAEEDEESEEEVIEEEEELITQPSDITTGDLIRGPDNVRVYLVNEHGYKRHVFNPAIFNLYGYDWGSIREVSQELLDAYASSLLYRVQHDYRVFTLEEADEEGGTALSRHLNITPAQFEERGYVWDQIFVIDEEELGYYQRGEDINEIKL